LSATRNASARFELGLHAIQERHAVVTDVRLSGLLMSFQISNDLFRNETLWGAAGCRNHLIEQGILTNLAAQATTYINLTPPLNVLDSEIDLFLEGLETTLSLDR
jgi:acetylornithine/succinyldiaminopimelate/putrescine aminotransferase